MKKLLLLLLLVVMPVAHASLVIQEVYVNPVAAESGGEALLLLNNGNQTESLSNLIIKTQTSEVDATVPENTTLQSGQTYLIADAGWSTAKDNASWPNASYEEPISLGNTNGGVAIIRNNSILDAVGWGAISDPALYQGIPAEIPAPGQSLVRMNNTGNNAQDFVLREPLFVVASPDQEDTQSIMLHVHVDNSPPYIESSVIGDETIILTPGALTEVPFTIIVGDPNGVSDIQSFSLQYGTTIINQTNETVLNATHKLYQGNVLLDYYTIPGLHNASILVMDNEQGVLEDVNFSVASLAAFSIADQDLFLTGVNLSSSTLLFNKGNTQLHFSLFGGPIVNVQSGHNVSQLFYHIDDNPEYQIFSHYQGVFSDATLQIGSNENLMLGIWAQTDGSLEAGEYQGSVSVVGGEV